MSDSRPERILVVGINFAPEPTGIGKYTGEMIDWLSDNGYECSVVTAFPYYPHWKIQPPYKGRFYRRESLKDGRLHLYRCPLYVPRNPSGIKRVIHDAGFFLSAFLMVFFLLFRAKHDYIFCVAPPFHLGFLGLFYRIIKGGKMIYHIQDLQVDAAKDLGIIRTRFLLRILFILEKYILDRCNFVSSISRGMIEKIKAKTNKHIISFPNWVDTERFFPLGNISEVKKSAGFSISDKIILYSGSIGEKQGLESILHVAKELKGDACLKFVICGSGPYKEKLQKAARELGLTNVLFYPLQPLEKLNAFLNMADVHLVLQKANAGDLVMPSKLTTILAVGGLSIVTSNPGTGLHEEVNSFNMGVLCEAENMPALINCIRDATQDEHQQTKANARNYAEKYLSIDNVISSYLQAISVGT